MSLLLFRLEKNGKGYSPNLDNQMCIVNTTNGLRKCIDGDSFASNSDFSPGGKYRCWYDLKKKAYYTYDLKKEITRNITNKINVPLYIELWDWIGATPPYRSKPVWLQNDEAVMVCDRYDIWKVDPTGEKAPVNMTNGYGRRNKIVLRYTYAVNPDVSQEPIKENNILLAAFDEKNKNNGFFRLNLNKPGDPEKLIMAPNVFYFPENFSMVDFPYRWVKARDADVFLLTRESPTEFPNIVLTKDFKNFTQISNLEPQKEYNWLTSELIRYKTLDAKPGAGILFKPENFDPTKKYPIVFSSTNGCQMGSINS